MKTITLQANGLSFDALSAGQGPVVLLLHGFPDDNTTWLQQIPVLAEAGYHVVAPLMRGYQPSSQPRRPAYHMINMAEDVLGWIQCLGEKQVHLVGHDWGAIIAYASAALAPRRFLSLTTLSVPHLRRMGRGIREIPSQLQKSWYIFLMQTPGVSVAMLERNDWELIDRLWQDWSPGWLYPQEALEQVKSTFRQPGVADAATRYYRSLLDIFSRTGQQSWTLLRSPVTVPTLAITGGNDGCLDTRLYDEVMVEADFPNGLQLERIAAAGHFVQRECPEAVNRLLLAWLAAHPAGA